MKQKCSFIRQKKGSLRKAHILSWGELGNRLEIQIYNSKNIIRRVIIVRMF